MRNAVLTGREKHLLLKALACAVVTISKRPPGRQCEREARDLLCKFAEGEAEANAYIDRATEMIMGVPSSATRGDATATITENEANLSAGA